LFPFRRDSYTERTVNLSSLIISASCQNKTLAGGYKVKDATGQSLAYVYGREIRADADTAHVLTMDEARRNASNIAKLPNYLAANPEVHD
jgi:hypothetical protein